jgi:hypothetical protein
MTDSQILKAQAQELSQIQKTADPHFATSTDRSQWNVLLTGGTLMTITAPLAAAVELEEHGFIINADTD